MARIVPYLLIMVAAVVSCTTRPLQLSHFKELEISKGMDKGVELALDLEDTTNIIMLQICMQIHNRHAINSNQTIPVIIETLSPDSTLYREEIELPLNVYLNTSSHTLAGGIRNYQWPYRKNIRNHTPGRWRFNISPAGPSGEGSIYKEITGVGISCKKEELDQ
ncbi:MAG: hypothetical protein IKY70_04110 [Bacteroidales bacterium]|nr:hypothetical protein [Bacteroidales bacterium]